MKLNLRGHEDRYAIEQSLLAFFPEERPVYEGEDGDSHAEVTLHEGNVYATGVTTLTYGGKTARGEARVRTAGVSDAYERERLRQRALKLSFFPGGPGRHRRDAQLGRADGHPPGQAGADHAGGRHDPRPGGPGAAGYVLRLPGAAASGAGERRGGPEGQERPAPRGHLSVHRHPLLPHPLRLLQLRVGIGGKVLQADGAVSGGADGGGGGRRPHGEGDRPADQVVLHGRRHAHHPVRQSNGCAADGGEPEFRPVRLRGILHRGGTAGHHRPGEAAGAAGSRCGPDQRKSPVAGAPGALRHRPEAQPGGYRKGHGAGHVHGLSPCEHGPDRRAARRHTGGLSPDVGYVPDLRRGQHHRAHPESEEGQPHPAGGPAYPLGGGRGGHAGLRRSGAAGKGLRPYYLYRQKYMSGSFENVGWCISGAEGLYNIYIMEELHSILSLAQAAPPRWWTQKRNRIERVFHPKFPLEYIQRPEKLTENLEAFRRFHQEMAR